MKGISATTKHVLTPLSTEEVNITISSIVTEIVDGLPIIVMPPESPTKIISIPASSAKLAVAKS